MTGGYNRGLDRTFCYAEAIRHGIGDTDFSRDRRVNHAVSKLKLNRPRLDIVYNAPSILHSIYHSYSMQ